MAKIVRVNRETGRPRRRYRSMDKWMREIDELAPTQAMVFFRGRDFSCQPRSFYLTLRRNSKQRGIPAAFQVLEDRVLAFRVTGKGG